MKRLIISFVILLAAIGCVAELEAVKTTNTEEKPAIVTTRTKAASSVMKDSLRIESELQQNKDFMMLNLIVRKEGKYVLFLTEEEAKMVGVTDEMYAHYEEMVKEMNKRNTAFKNVKDE